MQPALEANLEVIRQAVRGERPWSDLEPLGIRVNLQGECCEAQNPHGLEVSLDIRDLAHGLIRLQSAPAALRQWAFVLEAESFLDWDELEHHPAGEVLLNALWNASFGEAIPAEAITSAGQILESIS